MAREVLLGIAPWPVVLTEAGARSALVAGVTFEENQASAAYSLTAGTGSFALTGLAADLIRQAPVRQFVVASLPFLTIVTESAARQTLIYQTIFNETVPSDAATLTAERAAFAISGRDAALRKSSAPTADRGAFSLTGRSSDLKYGRAIAAASGAYSLTLASTLAVLDASRAAVVWSGSEANLIYAPVTLKLSAAGGALELDGGEVEFGWNLPFPAAAGTFALTGGEATFVRPLRLFAVQGALSLTGRSAELIAPRIIAYPIFPKVITAGPS